MKTIFKISLSVFSVFVTGIVFMMLWNWFLVPFGLPDISLAHSLGINVIIMLLISPVIVGFLSSQMKEDQDRSLVTSIANITISLLLLLQGYILQFLL